MASFRVLQIKQKNFKIKNFLKSIYEKNFLINKSFNNTPWIYLKNPNFKFYRIEIKKKIVGIAVIINLKLNTHLQFFYISKNNRSKGLGNKILQKILSKKKIHYSSCSKKINLIFKLFCYIFL